MASSNPQKAGQGFNNSALRAALAWSCLLFTVVLIIGYALTISYKHGFLFDSRGYVVGVDFVSNWTMGHFARTEVAPQENYDALVYNIKIRQLFDPDYSYRLLWTYPPSYVMAMVPFGLLPYTISWIVGTLLAMALLSFVVYFYGERTWKVVVVGLTSPASFITLVSGQFACVFASFQWMFFRVLDKHPYGAGVFLGLLSLKPQLGIAYPFFLVATGRWRTFFSAAITAVLLVMVSGFSLGWQMWHAYLSHGFGAQYNLGVVDSNGVIQKMIPTIYMDIKNFGISSQVAMTIQVLMGICVAGVFFTQRFKVQDLHVQQLVVAAAGVLMTPYLMPYDLLFFTVALFTYIGRSVLNAWGVRLVMGCFWLPVIYFVTAHFSIPGASLLPLGCIFLCLRVPINLSVDGVSKPQKSTK